ncbi:MAG: methyltransferase domain-containing protein [Anaerolineae bacterium]|nr:methyltransferase domain-containing protein [Anaerolineae bacterium]NIN94542.1 methyltransferase domain-containing protein [Anaerolineae bacterium]NIQ77604.1 methyltransferase domain-containing protein [Anaerolineae bacterium]
MNWLEISVEVDDDESAKVVGRLFDDWGQGGAVHEQLLLDEQRVSNGGSTVTTVKTYLPLIHGHEERRLRLEKELLRLAEDYPLTPPQFRELEEQDWASAWKSYFQPQRIGERLVFKLPEQNIPALHDEIVIDLEPGMAFGTGLHATTRMCLVYLEELVRNGDSVLDVGTGSGILAMAAARLGAGRVLALDSDPTAVRVARNNVSMNHLREIVEVQEGSLDSLAGMPRLSWDGITINIVAEVIANMTEKGLTTWLKPAGWLIAGGIVDAAEPMVRTVLEGCGMQITARHQVEDWVTLCAVKPETACGLQPMGRQS